MRLGLRAQILLALLLVTVGAITSIGAIAVWQTRQALVAERYERAAALTGTARKLAEVATDPSRPVGDPANRSRIAAISPELLRAAGAEELVFYDASGRPIVPPQARAFPDDAQGVAAALAGAEPYAREWQRRLVAYAPLRGGRNGGGAIRATFPLDTEVDARLSRTRLTLILLGALDGLVLLAAAAWILRGAVVRPVQALERAARRVADGDLTARVDTRGPGELASLADAFDRMTGSLREGRENLIRTEKLAGVGRLAAGVAHEVGNPLAAILGYVEMLLGETADRPLTPEMRRDMLERIRGETGRIHHIIQELLEYARPSPEEPATLDLRKAVDAALSLVRAQARGRGIQARVDLPVDLPAVRAPQGRVTQVLLNLLLNAADATAGKGTITIDARRSADRVVLTVGDDGPGVPVAARDKIFDPFFTTKDPGQGTGLGLAVSLAIVETLGGRLRLVPSSKGARFELDLPAVGPTG